MKQSFSLVPEYTIEMLWVRLEATLPARQLSAAWPLVVFVRETIPLLLRRSLRHFSLMLIPVQAPDRVSPHFRL